MVIKMMLLSIPCKKDPGWTAAFKWRAELKQLKVGKGVMTAGTDRCDAHAISSLKAFSLVSRRLSSQESNFNQVDIFPTTHVDHLRPGSTMSERVVGPLLDADTPK